MMLIDLSPQKKYLPDPLGMTFYESSFYKTYYRHASAFAFVLLCRRRRGHAVGSGLKGGRCMHTIYLFLLIRIKSFEWRQAHKSSVVVIFLQSGVGCPKQFSTQSLGMYCEVDVAEP